MTKSIKQILSLIVTVALIISSMPLSIFAQKENEESTDSSTPNPATDFDYTITDSQVTIDDYIGSATEVVIPAEIEGYPVTNIGDYAFYNCSSLTRHPEPYSEYLPKASLHSLLRRRNHRP